MPKGNAMLSRMEARIEAKYSARFHARMDMLMQMGQDAAFIAAHEVLGMGAGRAEAFCVKYMETVNQIANMMVDDSKEDPEMWYAKAKIDEQIRAILGDKIFVPWDVRYGRESIEEYEAKVRNHDER